MAHKPGNTPTAADQVTPILDDNSLGFFFCTREIRQIRTFVFTSMLLVEKTCFHTFRTIFLRRCNQRDAYTHRHTSETYKFKPPLISLLCSLKTEGCGFPALREGIPLDFPIVSQSIKTKQNAEDISPSSSQMKVSVRTCSTTRAACWANVWKSDTISHSELQGKILELKTLVSGVRQISSQQKGEHSKRKGDRFVKSNFTLPPNTRTTRCVLLPERSVGKIPKTNHAF